MKLKFLGTGTSQGIPVIGSNHPVCLSKNPKDKRLRTSALVSTNLGNKILIDCGPDFRQQMLTSNENRIDSVLITHEHNDHVIGLDDLRPLIFSSGKDMDIYAMERVGQEIKNRFPYAFAEEKYPGAPSFNLHTVQGTFSVNDVQVEAIPILHGDLPIFGYRIEGLAYITDASFIEDEILTSLKGLDVLVLNCLRKEPKHRTHFILPEALEVVKKINPKKAYLTHISHYLGFHDEVESELPENVHLAYDGLEIEF